MRALGAVLLVSLPGLACHPSHAPTGDPVPASEIQHRSFTFDDGLAFAPSLGGRTVEITFGRLRPGGGPFQLSAPGLSGTDGLPARIEGRFGFSGHLEVSTSTFDAAPFPELVPGSEIVLHGLAYDAAREALVVAGKASIATHARPNVVLVLTDDQRWDTLGFMPLTLDRLASRGVTFTNAYVTTPVCGPARACLLSGGFPAQETGVLTNGAPNGGFEPFQDRVTLATALQRSGYRTGFVGKYLNGYPGHAPYVPPGWTHFVGDRSTPDWFRYSVAEGSSTDAPTTGTNSPPIERYLTDYHGERALELLDEFGDRPFFLVLSTEAPHLPATPAPGDEGLFEDFVYRGRAYLETDRSDKPAFVQASGSYPVAAMDAVHRDMLRSLQALDRVVARLVDSLATRDLLEDTVVFYTSDNGYLWGEHGLEGKGLAYEESLRVPLVVLGPGFGAQLDPRLAAADLDVPATIFDLTGVPGTTAGRSLLASSTAWREDLLVESAALGSNVPRLWSGLIVQAPGAAWKYVEHGGGERELYDLLADPFEEQNVAGVEPAWAAELSARLAPRKGLAITTESAPPGVAGEPYELILEAWGLRGPPTWSLVAGALPDGLVLDGETGTIAGIPLRGEAATVTIAVEDGETQQHGGRPRRFLRELVLDVR